jgi:HPt (histidine-containing phosphotransfer) domain-containing protein
MEKLLKCLENGDLALYTTYVHGLKSACAYVGADRLSEMAKTLEIAGKNEDTSYIEKNNDVFVEMLERLLDDIILALSSLINDEEDPGGLPTEQFIAGLDTLKAALDDIDLEVINNTVDELAELANTDSLRTSIKNISKHILVFEYDEAVSIIDSILQEL